jgi:hypothetical protein
MLGLEPSIHGAAKMASRLKAEDDGESRSWPVKKRVLAVGALL